MGTSMGIFNMFIVIPQIIAAIGGINILTNLIGDKVIFSMVVAWSRWIYRITFMRLFPVKKLQGNWYRQSNNG